MAEAQLVDALLEKTTRLILGRRRFPESTYRLQLNAGFTFRDACALVPYLDELGITDCYASPYLKARPGSQHGYDILDHRALNPEIGSEKEYTAWVEALRAFGMGQIFDMVPNHMAIVGNENVWWNDVLENGPSSPYAGFFDIDWSSYKPALRDKVLLPILSEPYGTVLESQQLRLQYQAGAFTIAYFQHRFPVAPCSYGKILGQRMAELERRLLKEDPAFVEYQSILTAIGHLPPRFVTDPAQIAERDREKDVIKRRLATLTDDVLSVREFVEQNVALFNGVIGDPRSFDLLDDLLNDQAYRLSLWRVAADEINYRRFFDINDLAALSMERPEVFAATHELVLRLLREWKITGLRIDHPDGLYNPKQYLERVQQHFVLECARTIVATDPEYRDLDWKDLEGPLRDAIRQVSTTGTDSPLRRPLYLVIEKILTKNETLPEDWPVYGTTGYEFLNILNGLFIDADHVGVCSRIYTHWTKRDVPFRDLVYDKKFQILQVSLSGELHMLGHQLDRLAQTHRWSRDFTLNSLRHALRAIIASFPVYRSYISEDGIPKGDVDSVRTAVTRAKRKNPAISASIFDFVRDMLLLKHLETADEQERTERYRFGGKFQQVTAPVMAKGVEDTAFYIYNRLLSLNEVGGDPEEFGVTISAFHGHNLERQKRCPWNLSSTSTHDTKRSEDVRARLSVLSELPREWQRCLSRWNVLNMRHRVVLEEADATAPDRNEEYLLYQTLVGAWPLEPYNRAQFAEFVGRIQDYMQKAIHEAKEYTSWINPNPPYDDAVREFVARILDEKVNRRFLQHFRAFQRRISHFGLFNSLSQTLLKIASPGVPDTYQGTELWDFSLVDPDNRRPVDYRLRNQLLQELKAQISQSGEQRSSLTKQLTQTKEDGRIKLYVTYQALRCRREHPGLFSSGEYLPIDVLGARSQSIVAFARQHQGRFALVVVPRLLTQLMKGVGDLPLGSEVWQDTGLLLPRTRSKSFRNIFTNEIVTSASRTDGAAVSGASAALSAAQILANFPVALLLAQD